MADVDGDFDQDVVAAGLTPVTWWRNTPLAFCAPPLASPGDVLGLQAAPAPGWGVAGWTGSDDDDTRAWRNRVTMPGGDHAVAVHYLEGCFELALGHTGEGADPVATPSASDGCADGRYTAGQPILLIAAPADGWEVDGWTGTDDDDAIAAENTLTMPAGDHEVLVHYGLPCVRLTLRHGDGGDPVTDPVASPGGESCFDLALSRTGERGVPLATPLGEGLACQGAVVAQEQQRSEAALSRRNLVSGPPWRPRHRDRQPSRRPVTG